MSSEKSSPGLVRSLSLLDITMVGIASMIAGSIFNLIGPAINEAGPSLLIAFAFSGVISFFTALTYAELGSAFPEAGGGYRWVKEGLPRPNAFISGWTAWFAHMIAGSLYAVSFGSFFGSLLTNLGLSSHYGGIPLETIIAAIAVIIFTYVNYRGASLTGKVGNGLTFLQLGIIISFIVAGLVAWGFVNHNWATNFQNLLPKGFVGMMLGMGITYIAFEGYEIIVQTGEEVKNPKKNIPRAIFITLGSVTVIYIVFTFSFLVGLDPTKIGGEAWKFIGDYQELGIPQAAEFLLPFGTILALVGGMVSTVAGLSATTFSSSRVSFAMGRQYNLPYIFSSIHSKYHTPHFAIIASGFIMLVMASWLPVTQLAIAAGVLFLFLFTQVNWAGIQIRRLYGNKLDYGFKIPLFPIMPIIGISAKVGLAVFLLIYNPLSWAIAIVWILIGFSIYKLYISKKEIEHYAPLVASEGPSQRKDYRIMVVYEPKTAEKLAKLGLALAQDKQGEVSFLSVVTIPILVPLSSAQNLAEPATKSLDELKKILPSSDEHRFLVRLSHDVTEAILATVEEQGINLLIMDFQSLRSNRKLLSLTTCDIIGVHLKENFDNELSNIVVSYDKGRHSNLGLEIANSISKSLNSKIRIVRGVVESPEEERDILGRINEKMFDLDMKKIPVERVYSQTENVTQSLLQNFDNGKSEIIIVGAGNQSDQAFSPKTMEVVEKSPKTVFIIRNSRLSGIQARYFWNAIAPRLRENRFIYRMYLDVLRLIFFIKSKRAKSPSEEEDYFGPKM
ncbi:MAG TPA: amino acid permease [Nitrosopumilaceae archaeon]|nr:amino acid permease [Nitrosopumilaceae archaeon]